jgi:hypothetical protein
MVFPIPIADDGNQIGVDPRDGSQVVTFYGGLGGVQATQSVAAPARTVYGWVISRHNTTDVVASELLAAPIPLEAMLEQIRHPDVSFRFPVGMIR